MGRRGVSDGTKSLVSDMMKQSGLTAFQQRQLMQKMSNGATLPVRCNPTSSDTRVTLPSKDRRKIAPTVLTPKNYSGGKRQATNIVCSPREKFKPDDVIDRDEVKTFHQESLIYGKSGAEARKALREKARRKELVAKEPRKPKDTVDEPDEFLEAAAEVAELQGYLEHMDRFGQLNQQKRAQVQTKINHRVRQMKTIDRKRNQQLKQLEDSLT